MGLSVLDRLVRGSNLIVLALGIALLSYGGYVFSQCKDPKNVVFGAAVGIGLVDVLFSLLMLLATRNLFVLRLYGLIMGLLVIVELIIAIVFLADSNRIAGLHVATCENENSFNAAQKSQTTGWILLAVTVFQAITVGVVFIQVCYVDRPFDESAFTVTKAYGSLFHFLD